MKPFASLKQPCRSTILQQKQPTIIDNTLGTRFAVIVSEWSPALAAVAKKRQPSWLDENYFSTKENDMPRFDNTGPDGNGPSTGRGRGPCGDGQRRGFGGGRGQGLGRGQGRGGGRGPGRGGGRLRGGLGQDPQGDPQGPPTETDPSLQDRISELEKELSSLKKNLGEEKS
jgi:hypothetical protein